MDVHVSPHIIQGKKSELSSQRGFALDYRIREQQPPTLRVHGLEKCGEAVVIFVRVRRVLLFDIENCSEIHERYVCPITR
jgi:hypothetical protein